MLDTIFGLPVHILVIHVVVVVGPLAAVAAIAYALRPAWRRPLRWPLVVTAVTTAGFGMVAAGSGEELQRRVSRAGADAATMSLVSEHAEAGEVTQVLGVVFAVAVGAAVFALLPSTGGPRWGHERLGALWAVGLVVLSLALLGSITVTGHSGATAAWTQVVSTTNG